MASEKFEISLRGEARVYLPAERAVLRIDVSTTDHDKQAVSKGVVSAAKSVESLLRKLSPQNTSPESKANAAVDNWTRTSLSETSRVPYDHQKNKSLPREYSAEVTFEVQFQRFEAISGLLQDLAPISHVKTDPLEWVLTPTTKEQHRSGLRVESAKNAYSKALEYAQALGYKKVEPFLLNEGQAYAASSHTKAPRMSNSTTGSENTKKNMADAEAEDWEKVDENVFKYQPEDIKMTASVNASFYAML